MKFTKLKLELGKASVVASVGIFVSVFVSSKITRTYIDEQDFLFCVVMAVALFVLGALLLVEKEHKSIPGKWKGVKVKKDTTIHILVEED